MFTSRVDMKRVDGQMLLLIIIHVWCFAIQIVYPKLL